MATSIEFLANYMFSNKICGGKMRILFRLKLKLKSVCDVDSRANKYVIQASTTHTDRQKL